jgi:hypothetical protein
MNNMPCTYTDINGFLADALSRLVRPVLIKRYSGCYRIKDTDIYIEDDYWNSGVITDAIIKMAMGDTYSPDCDSDKFKEMLSSDSGVRHMTLAAAGTESEYSDLEGEVKVVKTIPVLPPEDVDTKLHDNEEDELWAARLATVNVGASEDSNNLQELPVRVLLASDFWSEIYMLNNKLYEMDYLTDSGVLRYNHSCAFRPYKGGQEFKYEALAEIKPVEQSVVIQDTKLDSREARLGLIAQLLERVRFLGNVTKHNYITVVILDKDMFEGMFEGKLRFCAYAYDDPNPTVISDLERKCSKEGLFTYSKAYRSFDNLEGYLSLVGELGDWNPPHIQELFEVPKKMKDSYDEPDKEMPPALMDSLMEKLKEIDESEDTGTVNPESDETEDLELGE